MKASDNMIKINARIDISASTLQTIVAKAKELAGRGADGHYHVDTADKVSDMISRFLLKKDFEAYVKNIDNYI